MKNIYLSGGRASGKSYKQAKLMKDIINEGVKYFEVGAKNYIKEIKMKIDVTEEQYKAFQSGESITLVPPKKEHVIEYKHPWEMNSIGEPHQLEFEISKNSAMYTLGELRKTKANAEYSLKRNQRANRLEALVEDLQDELGVGKYYDVEYKKDYYCQKMKESTYEKVCELLNSEQYSLEG